MLGTVQGLGTPRSPKWDKCVAAVPVLYGEEGLAMWPWRKGTQPELWGQGRRRDERKIRKVCLEAVAGL